MNIKLYKSPWRAIKLMLLCSIFVVIGYFMLMSGDQPRWLVWSITGFFALGYPAGIFHLLDRRPQIIINDIGIFDRTAYKDFINWEVIRGAYPLDINGQKFICLVVDAQYEPSLKKGKFARTMARVNKGIGAQELNIWLGQIRIDHIKLTRFIQEMIELAPGERNSSYDHVFRRELSA